MRFLFLFGVVALCATSSINAKSLEQKNADALRAVRGSVNTFALNFLKTVETEDTKNLICSPISVSTVLSMLYFGARHNTRNQLRNGLALPEDDTVVRTGFSQFFKSLENYSRVELRLANKIFLSQCVQPEKSFTSVVSRDFQSEVENVDFEDKRKASDTVNKWCSVKTNGRIKDILKPGDVDSDASLVLVNAVYFKGSWKSPFDTLDTKERSFHINAKHEIKIPTMYQYGLFEYGELPKVDATFLKLQYEMDEDLYDDDISMTIVLPNTVDGLAKVIKGLDASSFDQLRYGYERNCHVFLPKFKIESSLSLERTLQKMNMTDMFVEDLSDFTGIVRSPSLTVSKIVQKAFIDVNEKGSEAAAATRTELANRFGDFGDDLPDVTFKVDRPFLALITVGQSEPTILFGSTWYGPR